MVQAVKRLHRICRLRFDSDLGQIRDFKMGIYSFSALYCFSILWGRIDIIFRLYRYAFWFI